MINFHFDFYEIIVWVAVILMILVCKGCRYVPLKKPGGFGQPLANPICLIFPIVFFVLFAGFRKNVGDTYFYVLSFEMMDSDNLQPVNAEMFFTEMFNFFQLLIRRYTDDGMWLCMFSAIFALPVPLYILYKYTYYYEDAIFLFVAYGYIGGMMNGMRQYMATAIVLCGTKYLFSLKKSSFIKYAAIIMLAWGMHNSALIMIPMFFVVRRKAWQISSYLIILGSVVATLAFDTILPSFLGAVENTSYGEYANNGWFTSGTEGGSSIGRVVIAVAPIVIAFFNRERMERLGRAGDVLINFAFINAAIYMIATYNWIFARLGIYLMVYYMIFASWAVRFAAPPRDRMTYVSVFYVAFFLYSRFNAYQISMYISDYFFPGRKLFRS